MTAFHPKPKRVQWAPLSGARVEALKKKAYAEGAKNEDDVEANAQTNNAETNNSDHAFATCDGSGSQLKAQKAGSVSKRRLEKILEKILDFLFRPRRHRSPCPKIQAADGARFAVSKANIKRWWGATTMWGMCRRRRRRRRRRRAAKDIGRLYRERALEARRPLFLSTNDVVTAFLLREGKYAKAFMVGFRHL